VSETTEQTGRLIGEPGGGPGPGSSVGDILRNWAGVFVRQREATIFVVAVALFVYFGVSDTSSFISQSNAINLFSAFAAPIIIISIGEVLLLICGEIDLSVGFIYTFAPFIMFFMNEYYGVPAWLSIVLALVFGLVAGLVNGFITVALGVPSFITTLGTGFILAGLALVLSHAEPHPLPPATLTIGKYLATDGWAQFIWAVILVAIFHVVLTRTRWGLYTISTGGNALGAREAGINIGRIKYGNFMITGLLGAFVGVQVAFYTNDIDPLAGGYQPMFYAVTAAVIGGTAMLGGSGTILGAFIGAIVLAALLDGFDVQGINANSVQIVFGAAILIAMVGNVQLARIRERGRMV
jgi:simple sugar transport system permease protein